MLNLVQTAPELGAPLAGGREDIIRAGVFSIDQLSPQLVSILV
jgi:hypothetical protein